MFKKWKERRAAKKAQKQEKKEQKRKKAFDTYLVDLKIKTLRDGLSDVYKTEVKKKNEDGKEVVDPRMTASLMKTKARVALDFVDNLDKSTLQKK